jgi:S-adenosyl methyltransferase
MSTHTKRRVFVRRWALGSWLRRVVIACLDAGVDQFLDLGSGIPTVGNVHEIVQERSPDGHVVYVGYEPVAYYEP